KVSGVVRTIQGTLNSNGYLTLLSDPSGTALISGSGSGTIVGNIHLQRYLDPAFGYKYISSPLQGTRVSDLEPFMQLQDSVTGFPHFYKYMESREDGEANDLTGWEAYIDPSLPLNALEGYAAFFVTSGEALTI